MLIELKDANKALSSYLPKISSIIQGGWNDLMSEISVETRARNSTRTKRCLVHDFMVHRARLLEQEDPTVSVMDINQMVIMVIKPIGSEDSFGIRFKKLDDDGRSRNQPTKQVRKFLMQTALPEMPRCYHLEAGYIPDALGNQIRSIYWACPNGDKPYWHNEIGTDSNIQNVYDLFQGMPQENNSDNNKDMDIKVVKKKGGSKNDQSKPREGTGTDKP